ncbi:MAG: 5'/3'-nucleotidase SurE [Gammaproteobacteria bacterium GWE2_37_16]|nr:MAG: 5'/3'-nucleotidase SurE [Gammaproteobacteria bacterium GWE2_37_16]
MRILVSNDDGVNALGLITLANTLSTIGDIKVIAPDRNRSGASNSLTLENPLRTQELSNGYVSVTGTPTDCVHLALNGLWEDVKFDVVVSGINHGENLGDDVIYSGTVAAAMEARILGIPAIAVSLVGIGKDPKNYLTAALVAKQLVELLIRDPLPASTILNVNVPDLPMDEIKGFETVRLGTHHVAERSVKGIDPRGRPYYWIGTTTPVADLGPGTDFYAIKSGKVSITPLRVDMTNYTAFDQLSKWINGILI